MKLVLQNFPLLSISEYAINHIVASYLHTYSHSGIKDENVRESEILVKGVKIQATALALD